MNQTELDYVRGPEQWSELFLAIHKPAVVFACRINQTFATHDKIAQLTYDTVTVGAYTDVIVGMTCYIGTAAGLYDLGMVRIRGNATSSVLYIGETSEIKFADNLYLTVVDEFGIWMKPWVTPPGEVNKIEELVVYMDFDIAYSDQNTNCDPVPIMGPNAVLWLTGATVTLSPSAAGSWVIGSTITGYSWTAVGASTTLNMTTATPTITYNAAGQYRIDCTVTAANGKTCTGHRIVHVYTAASMPMTGFALEKVSCDSGSGGTSFTITAYQQSLLSDIRDRAHVILFAKDHYNGTTVSLGPIVGYENIIADGWIAGESIQWSSDRGQVQFTVQGPQYWLGKMPSFSVGLRDINSTPSSWLMFNGVTVDATYWHTLHWRTTTDTVIDIFKSGDTKRASSLLAKPGVMWEQLKQICDTAILATPRCNRYGQLYLQVDTQFIPLADRSGIPTTMALQSGDWEFESFTLSRNIVPKTGYVQASGIAWDGINGQPLISRAPGSVPKRIGAVTSKENLLLSTQAQLNELAALILAFDNNEYPSVSFSLAQNNRFLDIVPQQYVTLTCAAGDTPRGVTFTDKKFLIRRVEYKHEIDNGAILVDVELEAETGAANDIISITIPYVPPGNVNIWTAPKRPPYNPPSPGFVGGGYHTTIIPKNVPPVPPIGLGGATCPINSSTNGPYTVLLGNTIMQYDPAWFARVNMVIRSASHDNKTRYQINGKFQKRVNGVWVDTDEDNFYDVCVWMYDGTLGTVGIHDPIVQSTKQLYRTGYFAPPASLNLRRMDSTFGGSIGINIPGGTFNPASVELDLWYDYGLGQPTWGGPTYWENVLANGTIHSRLEGLSLTKNGWPWGQGYFYFLHMYPSVGETYQKQYYRVKGWHTVSPQDGIFPTSNSAYQRTRDDYGLSGVIIPSTSVEPFTYATFDAEFRNWNSIYDAPYNELQVGAGFTEAHALNEPATWLISWDFTVHPIAVYRIILQSLILWNICT